MVDDLLLRAAAFGGFGMVAMTVYLVAVRFVDWELIPRSALRRARWWQRHAHTVLWASLVVTAVTLSTVVIRTVV
ncbi:hypothetical protein [Actinokineospora sp.]|uniref:hypothetical protein n=1 Tax=Actinokineospora sp. TaxID=1872133 RepID=UPI0040379018